MKNKELKIGQRIETEHERTMKFISKYLKLHNKLPSKKLIFTNIAKDHLRENKHYYSKLRNAHL